MTDNGPQRAIKRPRILVGVDGSEDGLRAVTYASREARAAGGEVWIVHAVDEGAPATGLWDIVNSQDARRKAGEKVVAEAVGVAAEAGLPADRLSGEVRFGRPSDVLADLSRTAQMLVLGRRSLSGLERMFVGSTSVSAAVHAACPVIVISAASTPHETGGLRTVAVGVSTWPVHESALTWGLKESAIRKARLRVVHVVPESLGLEGAPLVEAASTELAAQLVPYRAKHPAVPVEVEVLLGDPVASLIAISKATDLLILGVHHYHAVLGGPTRAVLAHAHCPVGLIT